MPITDADREAANALRVILADICGFWHKPGDDSPLCIALARHREEAETRLAAKITRITVARAAPPDELGFTRSPRAAPTPRRRALPPAAAAAGD
jgi:hypothetical protein